MKKRLSLVLFLFVILCNAQITFINEIEGNSSPDNGGDAIGISLSMSNDGSIIAVGGNSGYYFKGVVKVYRDVNNNWQQIGGDIVGEEFSDLSGRSLDLSQDGLVVAIGAPTNDSNTADGQYNSGHVRVYRNVNDVWVQVGQDIDGEAQLDNSGNDVALSADGSVLVVAASLNDDAGNVAGHVRIYRNVNNNWVQIGQDIDGEAANDFFGAAVSVSNDGSIVAVGASGNNFDGFVKVYENQNDSWVQIGQKLLGDNANHQFGSDLSLSADGSMLAVGTTVTVFGTPGYVKVYQNISNSWIQVGNTITGNVNEFFGISVDMSSNGSIVAIGAVGDQDDVPGYAKVYANVSDVWTQLGNDIPGEFNGDASWNVAISGDGSKFAVGGPGHNQTNYGAIGHVRAFNVDNSLSVDDFLRDSEITIYPNPVSTILNISFSKNETRTFDVIIYNNQGQQVLNSVINNNKSFLDVSKFSQGLYVMEIKTEDDKYVSKLIIE